ncbi:uncharacterized protein V6R79_001143 [Siganus canaliculatus]
MHLASIPLCGLLLLLNLQLFSSYPIATGLTDTDMDILKVILHKLEESVPEQTDVDQRVAEEDNGQDDLTDAVYQQQPQSRQEEAAIRKFLSFKNLKTISNDSLRKSSTCFGRRMDRIGSMSSLGLEEPQFVQQQRDNMSPVVMWGLLVLFCQHTLVNSHILGRPSSASDLAQLKSLLGRIEETLAEASQREDLEGDYEATNQEPEHSQVSNRDWNLDQEEDQEPLLSERSQLPPEGHGRTASQRSRLQDLLLTARKRASSCFGARMDRIGNTSGLGCNNG